jgi:hypothetical protein
MNLGIIVLSITIVGSLSNWLNWRYLNYKITRLLYYVGAFVHETSHAVLCILTGAKIKDFVIFSSQPHVAHQKSKLPLVGELLISFAPIAGGLLFLALVNHYFLGNYFAMPDFSSWQNIFANALKLLKEINPLQWQSWVMILLFFNVGAMIGPSPRDLKNIWPVLILLFFVQSAFFADLGFVALSLILVNIALQIIFILVFWLVSIATGR